MPKFDNYVIHKIIEVEGIKVPSISYGRYKPYIDYLIYCDSDGDVYKIECHDYAGKYSYIKGANVLGHKPIDYTNDIVNMIVLKDDVLRGGRTHYLTIIAALRELNNLLRKNINLQDKLTEMGCKYGFSTNYIIRQK